jgi:hypothetical protein
MRVTLALFACWLAYQLHWIRARHDYLQEHGMLPLEGNTWAAPWSLRPFGEPGISMVGANTNEELAIVQGLFPEASYAMP